MKGIYTNRRIILRRILSLLTILALSNQLWVGGSLYSSRHDHASRMEDFDLMEADRLEHDNFGKRIILDKLHNAGLNLTSLDKETLASIPDWMTIRNVLGSSTPHILGLETCETFQSLVQNKSRYIGVSGFFNSGTNLLAYLLDENCEFPDGKGQPLWQVPWGKHTGATAQNKRTVPGYEKYNKSQVLPAVMVRNPFEALESLCKNPYSVHYTSSENVESACPFVVDHQTGKLLAVDVGKHKPWTRYPSIVHYWNQWYQEYANKFSHPRLIIRLEDLTIYPKETVRTVCECAGGTVVDDEDFKYLLSSAKKDMGHGEESEKNGLIEAWSRIGREVPFSVQDYEATQTHLDRELMAGFRYKSPQRKQTKLRIY